MLTTLAVSWWLAATAHSRREYGEAKARCPRFDAGGPDYILTAYSYGSLGHAWIAFIPAYPSRGCPYSQLFCEEPPWRLQSSDVPQVEAKIGAFPERPRWPAWLSRNIDSPDGLVGYYGQAAGWPLPALRSVARATSVEEGWEWSWTYRYHQMRGVSASTHDPGDGTLPLQPIPLGFAANTALAAPIWWLILGGPLDVRRWLHRRRNQCERCAYARDSLADATPCPECGVVPAIT